MTDSITATIPARLAAVLAYVPVLGWLVVFLFQRANPLAMYHLRQSIGLVLFLLGLTVGWAVVGWVIAWIPYAFVVSIALFALVMAAYFLSVVILLLGLRNALRSSFASLPLFGGWANRLPIR